MSNRSDLPTGAWIPTVSLLVIAGLALRARLALQAANLLHADEAIFGLMALDFAAGEPWNAYFAAQGYMGSLIATLAWPLVAWIGPTVTGLRLIELGLWLCSALIIAWLPLLFGFSRPRLASLIATALYCLSSISMQTWSIKIMGYQENLTLVLAMLVFAAMCVEGRRPGLASFGVSAFAALAFWALPISLYGIVPVAVLLASRRCLVPIPAATGLLIGGLPWLHGFFSSGATGFPPSTSSDHLLELPSRIYNLFVMSGALWGGIGFEEIIRAELSFQLSLGPSLVVLAVLAGVSLPVFRRAPLPVRAATIAIPALLAAAVIWRFQVASPEFQVGDPEILGADILGARSLGILLAWVLLGNAVIARVRSFTERRRRGGELLQLADLPVLMLASWLGLWCASSFGLSRCVRYSVPLFVVATLCLAQLLSNLLAKHFRLAAVAIASILLFNGASSLFYLGTQTLQPTHLLRKGQILNSNPVHLLEFLDERGIDAIVGKFHLVTQLGYLSNNRIATSAIHPDRLPKSDKRVSEAERWAVLFHQRSNESQIWQHELESRGIDAEIKILDGFMVAIHDAIDPDHPSRDVLVTLTTIEHGTVQH